MVARMQLMSEHFMESEVWAAALSSYHEELAIADTRGNLLVVDVRNSEVREHYVIPDCWITSLKFARDSTQLIIGTLGCGGWWLDRPSGHLKRLHLTSLQNVTSLAVSPSGQWLALVGEDSSLCVGECSPKASFHEVLVHKVPNPNSVAFSPDSRLLAIGGGEGTDDHAYVGLINLKILSIYKILKLSKDTVCIDVLSFSPNGELLLAGGYKECAIIRLTDTPVVETTLPASSWCSALSFDSYGCSAVIGDDSGGVTFYSLAVGARLQYQLHGKILCIDSLVNGLVDVVVAQLLSEQQKWVVRVMRFELKPDWAGR